MSSRLAELGEDVEKILAEIAAEEEDNKSTDGIEAQDGELL